MGDSLDDVRAEQRLRWEASQAEEQRKARERALFEMDRMPEPPKQAAEKPTEKVASAEQAPSSIEDSAADSNSTKVNATQAKSRSSKDRWRDWDEPSSAIVPLPRQQPKAPAAPANSSTAPVDPIAAARQRAAAAAQKLSAQPPVGQAGATSSSAQPPVGQAGDAHQNAPPVVLEGNAVDLPLCGCGMIGDGGASEQLFAMAGIHAPSEDSFTQFFHEWFVEEHFPTMSQALQKELVQRAKSKGFFSGLASQVKKWAMANTDVRLQADVWCSYFVQNTPPRFRSFGCVRSASVNLGSQAAPCHVTFLGLPDRPDHWMLAPWASLDVECGALLDELDGRGGMAALLAAAA